MINKSDTSTAVPPARVAISVWPADSERIYVGLAIAGDVGWAKMAYGVEGSASTKTSSRLWIIGVSVGACSVVVRCVQVQSMALCSF